MTTPTIDTNHFKNELEKELKVLEKELKTVGRKNPDNPEDWQATPAHIDVMKADDLEVAENIEQFEGNTAILKELEIQYNDVKRALEKITAGTYGICKDCGKPIELKRLEADPSAETCMVHMEN